MAKAKKIVKGSGKSAKTVGYVIKNAKGEDVIVKGGKGKAGYVGRVKKD